MSQSQEKFVTRNENMLNVGDGGFMQPSALLGFAIIVGGFILFRKWRAGRNETVEPSGGRKSPGIDVSVRANAEKALHDRGVIGGSALNAPRGFETAYSRVMSGVHADNGIKAELYKALAQNQEAKTYEKFLRPGEWEWPEFEEWKKRFLEDGKFPYMWKQYPEICMTDFENFRLSSLLERMRVNEIKELLQKLQIDIPAKSKKADLLELAEREITIKTLQEKCPEVYESVKEDFQNRVNRGKCAILEHTISMLGYHLRDFYTNSRVKIDIIPGCPVEAKYAKGKGKISENNIPPFFPGDRTGTISVRKK